jgi:hypothetical protein
LGWVLDCWRKPLLARVRCNRRDNFALLACFAVFFLRGDFE